MSTFKSIIANDIHNTFLNTEEFSDMHVVNGEEMPLQMDDIEQINREKRYKDNMDGIFVQQRMIYVAASDYGPLPKKDSLITLDGRKYRVADAIDEYGVYSITLEANRA